MRFTIRRLTYPFASLGVITFLATATISAAQTGRAIADLYPSDEHCIFVPLPVWPGVNPQDGRHGRELLPDRSLAFHVPNKLKLDHQAVILMLEPETGLIPLDLNLGGEGLRRALALSFTDYVNAWRQLRDQALSEQATFNLA